jgi:hypothetical protein
VPAKRKEDVMKHEKKVKAHFVHDCDCCVFVQSYETRQKHYDLYVNEEGYLVRHGNEPGQYFDGDDLNKVMAKLFSGTR